MVMIGMNVPTPGRKHKKQLQAIENCIAEGIFVHYVGYTLEHIDHMEEVLEEIQSLGTQAWQYRIRQDQILEGRPMNPIFK